MGTQRAQKVVPDPLELQLEVFLSCPLSLVVSKNQVFIIEHQVLLTTGSFSLCPSAGFDAWDRLGWCWDCMVGAVWVQDTIWAKLWECQLQTCEEDHPNKLCALCRYAPVGILFLIAGKILEMEDMAVLGGQLGMYTLTVIVGLFLHAGGVLPLIYFLVTHRNPFPFIGGMLQALITAMGTSSRYDLSRNSPWVYCSSFMGSFRCPPVHLPKHLFWLYNGIGGLLKLSTCGLYLGF